jgi:PKD repeat protein
MKSIVQINYLFLFLSLITISCNKTKPIANFSFDGTSKPAPVSIQFTNTSSDAVEYSWDFGDGGSSTEENPSHQYKNAGTYTITLLAKNKKGDSNILTKPIIVLEAPTIAVVTRLTVNSVSNFGSFDIKINNLFVGSLSSTSIPQSISVSSIPLTPLTSPSSLTCYYGFYDSFSGMWQSTTYINTSITPSNYIVTGSDNPYPSKINVTHTQGVNSINLDLDVIWK